MTPLVPHLSSTLLSGGAEGLAMQINLVVIGLLVVLLILREALRGAAVRPGETPTQNGWTRALDLAIVPLLVAFCQIIGLRLVALLS